MADPIKLHGAKVQSGRRRGEDEMKASNQAGERMGGGEGDDKRQRFLSSLESCTNLPSPPVLAAQLVELGKNPDVSIAEVSRLIGLDPATSAKIMRLANSALYARQRKIENLRQAINLFGLEGSLSMALSISVVGELRGNNERQSHFDFGHYWRRSIASATACQVIGNALAAGRREEVFLAGLLQDIGMLVINAWSADFYQSMDGRPVTHEDLQAFELDMLGMDHAAVGSHVLNAWSFPDILVNAIAGSHHPLAGSVSQEFITVAKVLNVASDIADLLNGGVSGDNDFLLLEKKAQELLGIDREKLTEVISAVAEEVQPLADLFDIDLGENFVAGMIADQAREVLMVRNLRAIQEASVLKQVNVNLQRKTRTLEEENRRDPLTFLYNRAYHDKIVHEEFSSAQENHWPLSLAFIDLDHFKAVNDTYGHQTGDAVLQRGAQLLVQATRGSDVVARYGGEEFVIIMPGTAEDGVKVVCRRILEAFRQTEFDSPADAEPFHVTASIGIAAYHPDAGFETAEDLVRAADKAVYAAKLAGRDRMIFYDTRYND